MENRTYLSREKHEELTTELNELKTSRRREVAERLEFAKSLGDLSENAEYHAARDEQAEIEDRIGQLEMLLKNSEIITAHHSSAVELGSTLKVKRLSDSQEQTFSIVGSEDADLGSGKISHLSPIGAALIGRKRGETEYKIISLE